MRHLLLAFILALCVGALAPAWAQVAAEGVSAGTVASGTTTGGPIAWRSLSTGQRAALQPLEKSWPTLGADQQRKWVALTQNYDRMAPEERSTLQSRMTEWVSLTPAQRTQARLNFGEVRQVPADEKRAKWEEYQALPAEERERLANDRPKPPIGAAPALRPVPADRLLRPTRPAVPVAAPNAAADGSSAVPRVNRHTLLPQQAASAAR
ncbi:DUF3106 domain-containing protein [Ottowia testudinis]|uniref:DUF3106 domain-containing protein n=1 Tax=Ottowia testudinis TaxID=2816950 RepID=A0A975CE24_9BURK|nr:DUF3106 domain-containing protein [Ottowia testudinis]QTD44061.1 DUF3106 domain-containing protein [Ottowia testudinis]